MLPFWKREIGPLHGSRWNENDDANGGTVKQYDMVVIGGGMAGLAAAKASADLKAKTALVERDFLGGT